MSPRDLWSALERGDLRTVAGALAPTANGRTTEVDTPVAGLASGGSPMVDSLHPTHHVTLGASPQPAPARGFTVIAKLRRTSGMLFLLQSNASPEGRKLAVVKSECGTALYCTHCRAYNCADHCSVVQAWEGGR